MAKFMKLFTIALVLCSVSADFPLDDLVNEVETRNDVDPTIYRLPEDLDPIHFEVEITPYFEAENGKEAFSFDGNVKIVVRAARDDITSLIIQENVRKILSITLTDIDNNIILLNETNPFERLSEYHFLKINLRDGVTLTRDARYIITIAYIGNINETPLSRGVFRGSYVGDDGRVHWYAACHLQPTNSRQAFPSFDEPGFKSTFDIIINRPSSFTHTYSNMRIKESIPNGNRVKEIFHTTPIMPAYLVTIHISEEFTEIADNGDEERSYRIIARPNAQGQGDYALEIGSPITEWLEDYFNISYYSMGEDMKNDQIAVPNWASGATENWGLVSYRELRLLYEEGETNAADKMSIGTITAHELGHKWFGNLITCRWWDNVWINEGFASYFEYFAMDGVDKSMQLEEQFNIMYVQSSLSTDSGAATRALQHTVNSPTEVTGHFSGISYSKGASLLLMLKHFMTEDTFKKALHDFLVEKSFDYAYPEDIYRNFQSAVDSDQTLPSDVNITSFMQYWVDEPGYPLVHVHYDPESGNLDIKQERFFINSAIAATEQRWPLPLTFTTGQNPNWEDLKATHVMTGSDYEISTDGGEHWVIFNLQQKNIYRVTYDDDNWLRIAEALKENPSSIHHLNRAQIVDDVFALMRAEKMTYDLGFKVLEFLKDETSYFVWFPAVTGYSWLRNRILHLPEQLAEFDTYLHEQMDTVISSFGYNVDPAEPLVTTLNRFYTLTFACNAGHEGCLSDAAEKYQSFRNGNSLNPNLRRHVLCAGLRQGGYEDWQMLHQRRMNSNNQADELAMLRALGCTTNEQAVNEQLSNILNPDIVKAQDTVNALSFLYMGDRNNAKIALKFLEENTEEIRKAVVLPAWFSSVLSNLAAYLDEEGLNEMEDWLRRNQNSLPEYAVGMSAVTSARTSIAWGTEWASTIMTAVRGSSSVTLPSALVFIMAIAVAAWQ